MTTISVDTDDDNLTVTLVSDFEAPVEQVWQLWADARKLERWWGPPSYPATFVTLDLVAGGEVRYFMTDSGGEQHPARWRVTAVNPPVRLEFDDVFDDTNGDPDADLPIAQVSIELIERGGGTRMVMRAQLESRDDFERWLSTGTREGLEQAAAQMDALLRP